MKNHIVCLSTTNYHPLPTRKQNVMSRLNNSEVLYFDPPVSVIAPLKDKKASAYIKKYKQPGEKVEGHENITVYALPPVLPFFNKYRWINKLNQKRQAKFVRKKMREHGFGEETVLSGATPLPRVISWSTSRTRRWCMTVWTVTQPIRDTSPPRWLTGWNATLQSLRIRYLQPRSALPKRWKRSTRPPK